MNTTQVVQRISNTFYTVHTLVLNNKKKNEGDEH